MASKHVLEQARAFIPSFTGSAHKGQAGKIAVIGGCREYTGKCIDFCSTDLC